MDIAPCPTLTLPLKLPVRIRFIDRNPKIIAGGVPVIPMNLVLQERLVNEGATSASIETYLRAARLYVEFCAHRRQSLIGITNEEFIWFKNALLGQSFPDAQGKAVQLSGKRGNRTADLMLTLLYSLTADITERYRVSFDWRRYKGVPDQLAGSPHDVANLSRSRSWRFRRSHRIKWTPPKIVGLPDNQFAQLLSAAYDRWGKEISDGDIAFTEEPEIQRGALFYRNLAILLVLRCAGSRRSEVVQLRIEDIDRENSLIYLVTKGHRADGGRRLPVLMVPWVEEILWHYVTHYRPVVSNTTLEDQQSVFLSHSVRNYGKQVSDESVRALLDTLCPSLDAPWDKHLTPHTLRHSYGYDLQKLVGPSAIAPNMRHATIRSIDPYLAGVEAFADQLVTPENEKLGQILNQAGLLERFPWLKNPQ